MTQVDPRERRDDLIVTETRQTLDPASFAADRRSETASVGWVVLALVHDGDRVLLLDEPWADGWQLPGGTPKPDEPLPAAVRREVREETGVQVTPVRPHAVNELTVEHRETGATAGWNAVVYEAVAETTAVADDPGLPGEDIGEVRWFETLPGALLDPDLTRRVYDRCVA